MPSSNFFLTSPATTEIYTLSLHDALPICANLWWPDDRAWCVVTDIDLTSTYVGGSAGCIGELLAHTGLEAWPDRKSTRLNSSHVEISYAVFCLKKKTDQPGHEYRASQMGN